MNTTTNQKILIDLNTLVEGPIKLAGFRQKVDSLDFSQFQGKDVQLKGCAPTWAHLMVASKLYPFVSSLDFLLDDAKKGQNIPIF